MYRLAPIFLYKVGYNGIKVCNEVNNVKGSIARKKYKNVTHYYVVYDLPKLANEKRKQRWVSVGTSYREAEKKLPEIMLQAKKQMHPDSQTLFFEDVANDYLFNNQGRLAGSTYKRYTGIVNYLNHYFAHTLIAQIEPYHIEQLHKQMVKEQYKANTVLKYRYVLKQIFDYAIDLQIISTSPLKTRQKISSPSSYDFQVWTSREGNSFLQAIENTPLYMPVNIALHTGMRLGEILALKWSEIDLTKAQLTVRYSVDLSGKLKTTKTKQSRRTIKLVPELVDTLKAHRHWQKVNQLRLGDSYHKSDFVCTFEDGHVITRNYVSVTFRRKVRQLHFPVIRFHDLRHTFATIALSHNVHTKVVQEILGHASSRTTLDVYSHVIPTMQEQSLELLSKAFES